MDVNLPLILSLRIDEPAQLFFDELRARYFPPERNFLKAHLTLFHKLPDTTETINIINSLNTVPFQLEVTEVINLGSGVAYRLESRDLMLLHKGLRASFHDQLSAQDRQGFRPHITVQNKTTPGIAKALQAKLSAEFKAFTVSAVGLDLWRYLGGPWSHYEHFPFTEAAKL